MWSVEYIALGLCILGAGLCPGVNCDNHGTSDNSWEVCKKLPEKGTKCADKWTIKWYYNDTLDRCDRFWYGGCDGNDNNFENEIECKSYCMAKKGTENIVITEDDSSSSNRINPSTSLLETCQQQPYQGTCRDFVVKWFYNPSSQVCERFWYGGCDGNANNFDDEDDCRRTCLQAAPQPDDDICKQPSVTGRCRARHIRWYYNSNRKECQQFTYGGCGGNQNRFRTLADCQRQCLSGTEALGDQHICRNSRYGCCPDGVTSARGNNNEGCPNACQATLYGCCDDDLTAAQGPNQEGCDEIEGSGEPCNMTAYGCCPDGVTAATGPAEEGCDIFIVDPQPKPDTDSDITVGGQDGREVSVLCQLAKNTGPCKNYTVMWYYNTRENQCERFWYGGCDGNTNRFKSEKECVTTCQNMIFRGTGFLLE